jgi:hypothetical protein
MKEIGGFFELELNQGKEYHHNALALNSGRNCLRYIVRNRNIQKLLVPFYACDAIFDILEAENVEIIPYHISENFLPVLKDFQGIDLLYINYFGICTRNILKLHDSHQNIIIDNSQAFFSFPYANLDTFYSSRKYFGVPDGGYVYCSGHLDDPELEQSISFDKCDHLLRRIDQGAKDSYSSFLKIEEAIRYEPIRRMSSLTRALLRSINYEAVRQKRLENFGYLHEKLIRWNQLQIEPTSEDVPMVYPFLTSNNSLRKKLIDNSIYVATYWPDDKDRIPRGSTEAHLVSNIIPLPIDQRYGRKDMDAILNIILATLPTSDDF